VVTDFNVLDKIANRNDDAGAFMASDERELGGLEALLVLSLWVVQRGLECFKSCEAQDATQWRVEGIKKRCELTNGQSPLTACKSVWQTPEYLMLTRTSSGPGFWTGIFL
jgi:hypothetical protein